MKPRSSTEEQHIQFPKSTFRGSVFDAKYFDLVREDPYDPTHIRPMLEVIRSVYFSNEEEYMNKGLDTDTEHPIRYRHSESHKIEHMPGWRAVIIGEKSESRLVKPRTNSLGYYALRQSLYFFGRTEQEMRLLTFGELIPDTNYNHNETVYVSSLSTGKFTEAMYQGLLSHLDNVPLNA